LICWYLQTLAGGQSQGREKNVTWLEPRRDAQIAFQEWTADQKLRQPVFLGLRDDKEPNESVLPE
jgi:bifunctional non-homologous end joining protein LigD